jgi:hypothetical protein
MVCCHVNKMLLTIGYGEFDELPTFCEIYIYE